jgi:hypothetical protein
VIRGLLSGLMTSLHQSKKDLIGKDMKCQTSSKAAAKHGLVVKTAWVCEATSMEEKVNLGVAMDPSRSTSASVPQVPAFGLANT